MHQMADRAMFFGATPEIFARARELRSRLTQAEKLLWKKIGRNQLLGYRFKQQHPIGNYVVDFYCHKAKLVVELDGAYHDGKDQKTLDEGRGCELESLGLVILRFKNEDLQNQMNKVIETIKDHLARAHPLTP
jgi:very-short-patch-repair endonuclease